MAPVVAPPITAAGLRRLARGLARGSAAERRSLMREAFFRIAERYTPAVAAEFEDMRLYLSTRDRVVSVATFCDGPFELEYLERAVAALAAAGHEVRGRRFVEVGANIGTTTVPLVVRFGAAGGLAIEPEPGNARLLDVNLAANDLLDRVQTLRAAVSDRAGTMRLALAADNHGDHRLATGTADGAPTIEVATVSLDALVEDGRIDPAATGVVWVDVQGHEGRVLAGARAPARGRRAASRWSSCPTCSWRPGTSSSSSSTPPPSAPSSTSARAAASAPPPTSPSSPRPTAAPRTP